MVNRWEVSGGPPLHMHMIDASKDEAALAVHLYNDPSESLSFEGFDVHRHLAWLYLLHAELTTLNQYGARLGSGPGAGSCWRRVGVLVRTGSKIALTAEAQFDGTDRSIGMNASRV